ncbi:hypothetical protein K504DRAFT_243555 [Pleomassaria siparia CBS 279.74]|uniref:Uncharacterized protein n=1 Tax=Pleomassaria siparia CBS 279.74 TaxID=1314801 RepID=A0A6G1KEW3_9PLEO|nr:hypothetical protein K504DRAFT_243555 [Pleomassaria siparia CBS 279.74]
MYPPPIPRTHTHHHLAGVLGGCAYESHCLFPASIPGRPFPFPIPHSRSSIPTAALLCRYAPQNKDTHYVGGESGGSSSSSSRSSERTANSRQQTADSRQQTADSGQRTANSGHPTASNQQGNSSDSSRRTSETRAAGTATPLPFGTVGMAF